MFSQEFLSTLEVAVCNPDCLTSNKVIVYVLFILHINAISVPILPNPPMSRIKHRLYFYLHSLQVCVMDEAKVVKNDFLLKYDS